MTALKNQVGTLLRMPYLKPPSDRDAKEEVLDMASIKAAKQAMSVMKNASKMKTDHKVRKRLNVETKKEVRGKSNRLEK